MQLNVVQLRGAQTEGVHPIAAVRVDEHGEVLDRIGPPTHSSWRSAAKPFQLEANLSILGGIDALGDADLALGAASHSAQPMHIDRVVDLLRRLDRTPEHLYCGAHPPIHGPSSETLIRRRETPASLHNNCSGKHAFMAAAAAKLGSPEDYRAPDHPLQALIRAHVDARCAPHIVRDVSVDGCGVPAFNVSLEGMATAWARMASAMEDRTGSLGRIGWAMHGHPELVSGDHRQDVAQMRGSREPIVTKVGAMGLSCIALPHSRQGIAVKVLSGDDNARPIAVQAVLERWFPGLLVADAVTAWRTIHNCAGDPVGARETRWKSA